MALIGKIKKKAWFFLHLNRRNPIIARFGKLCKNIHRATEHPTYNILFNGEQAAVMRLAGGSNPVIFDVGANIGEWSAMTLALFPKATIHAFELNPVTAEALTTRFASADNVHIHPFGLGDRTASIDFYAFSGPESVLSSIRSPLHQNVSHTMAKAQLVRGDEFCPTHGIDFINFLKVDAEHADMEVLQGLTNMLQKGKVGCVQFEHEGGRYLKDFFDFLNPMGYSIGKLYANYIDFRDYEQSMEVSLGPNYVALPTRESAKIKELIKGW